MKSPWVCPSDAEESPVGNPREKQCLSVHAEDICCFLAPEAFLPEDPDNLNNCHAVTILADRSVV